MVTIPVLLIAWFQWGWSADLAWLAAAYFLIQALDGKELERNVDYFVDHENGVFWVKNTDLVHVLRVIEVEFEYEQIPRKELGVVSMTDLLPKDGVIGQLRRSMEQL